MDGARKTRQPTISDPDDYAAINSFSTANTLSLLFRLLFRAKREILCDGETGLHATIGDSSPPFGAA